MKIIYAENIDEAINIANSAKKDGFDWFRGQTNSWLLIPSLIRLEERTRKEVANKLERFVGWLFAHGQTRINQENLDHAIAIAQHYGIPTTFIDFTTEPKVAAFFAANGKYSKLRDSYYRDLHLSCIYCLNSAHTQEKFNKHLDWYQPKPPRLLKINVDNLWRLQAQKGTFLDWSWNLPVGLEDVFLDEILDFFCIRFPYSGPNSILPKELIYPNRKSELEILLDQYFQSELIHQFHEESESMGFKPIGAEITLDDWRRRQAKAFITKPPILESWKIQSKKWRYSASEKFDDLITNKTMEIVVNRKLALELRIQDMYRFLVNTLGRDRSLRKQLIKWKVLDNNHKKIKHVIDVNKSIDASNLCNEIWDGMRTLPYTNRDIAICIATTLGWIADTKDRGISANIGKKTTFLEIASSNGGYNRAIASSNELQEAVRADMLSFILPQYRMRVDNKIDELLGIITEPNRIFEFKKLLWLFPRQIIPSQILLRDNEPVFYSPAEIDVFGLA